MSSGISLRLKNDQSAAEHLSDESRFSTQKRLISPA